MMKLNKNQEGEMENRGLILLSPCYFKTGCLAKMLQKEKKNDEGILLG